MPPLQDLCQESEQKPSSSDEDFSTVGERPAQEQVVGATYLFTEGEGRYSRSLQKTAERRFETSFKRLKCANSSHSLKSRRTGQIGPLAVLQDRAR